jgi:hypothetical protein
MNIDLRFFLLLIAFNLFKVFMHFSWLKQKQRQTVHFSSCAQLPFET